MQSWLGAFGTQSATCFTLFIYTKLTSDYDIMRMME